MQQHEPAQANVSVDIESDVADVWNALTTNEGLAAWMGAESQIDPVVGGNLTVADPVTGQPKRGYVCEFVPGERLGFVWWPSGDSRDTTTVDIMLEPCVSGTRVTVFESAPTGTAVATASAGAAAASGAWAWRTALLVLGAQTLALVGTAL